MEVDSGDIYWGTLIDNGKYARIRFLEKEDKMTDQISRKKISREI